MPLSANEIQGRAARVAMSSLKRKMKGEGYDPYEIRETMIAMIADDVRSDGAIAKAIAENIRSGGVIRDAVDDVAELYAENPRGR